GEPRAAAVCLGVDGVLAPMVDDPRQSRVPEAVRAELRRLAGRYGLVACVTGRPSADAQRIVGVPELRYVGEHGLELEPDAARFADEIHRLAVESGWADVERKPYSAALHYRTAPDRDQ